MAADRALRHVERLRPGGEAQAQTDRVERPQGIQREPATIDRLRLGDRGFLKALTKMIIPEVPLFQSLRNIDTDSGFRF